MKGVQCYELFGGIALKNHTFSLRRVHTTNPGFLDDIPTLPIIQKLDEPPSFDELEKAILSLKNNKTAGPDNIPAEVIKYGRCALHRRLHAFTLDCWSAKCLPQQWTNANIILVYKQKGTEQNVATVVASPFSL